MELVRSNIATLKPYIAGKPIEETKRELGLRTVIKLASNENPLGPSPKAVAAMRKVISQVHRYPDSGGFYLKSALAKAYGITPDHFVLGNGSDELIDTLIKTFVAEDENIVTADVTFLEYKIIAQVNNRQVRTAPLSEFRFDLRALAGQVTPKTKMVFIANPNNPTGTYVGRQEFEAFLSLLPPGVIVVLDEAYDAFIDVKDFPDSVSYRERNVVALKTFSKAYGLAGVRVGYAVASPRLTASMEKTRQPFNVNLPAQAAAAAALGDKAFLRRTRRVVLEGKKFLYAECRKLGVTFVPSVANFILIDTGRDCVEVFKAMLRQGVIVRDMKQYDLDTFIRVTIGMQKENERFVRAFARVMGRVA
jgi:histidinol-phosphate aminotransferase